MKFIEKVNFNFDAGVSLEIKISKFSHFVRIVP
jgi:hypothetical protein